VSPNGTAVEPYSELAQLATATTADETNTRSRFTQKHPSTNHSPVSLAISSFSTAIGPSAESICALKLEFDPNYEQQVIQELRW
jgi:hypothetical protein